VMAVVAGRPEKRIALQLYGKAHPDLVRALRETGAEVTTVPIYAWAMPEDTAPLVEAVKGLAAGHYHVALFTTSHQIVHLMEIARELGIEAAAHAGLKKTIVASIGPSTSEMLHEFGIEPAMEPSHPKLGFLVKEAAEYAGSRTS
jgi:uroporphyrinogen-III synthase